MISAILTIGYGALGAVVLWASLARGCPRCVHYSAAMMASWFGSAWALMIFSMSMGREDGAAWAPVLIIPIDGSIALLVGANLARRYDIKGAMILELFGLEMFWHLVCWGAGLWGGLVHYVGLNVIYVAQVIIAGGSNVLATLVDWRGGRTSGAGPDHLGARVVAGARPWKSKR